jgi:hypothetical protein
MQAIIKELYGLNIKQNLTIKQLEARFQQEQEEQRALKVKSNILQITDLYPRGVEAYYIPK